MAKQARCRRCKLHYVWDKEHSLDGARCPKCGEILTPTTYLCKDKELHLPPDYQPTLEE